MQYLDFEQPIAELLAKISELKRVSTHDFVNIQKEIEKLEMKSNALTKSIFKKLTPWQIVQLARHPLRPHSSDYISSIISDFQELKGDRLYGDDKALIGGIGRIGGHSVVILAQEKGRTTPEKIKRNFGMMHPEGYRKAKRLALMAEKFNLPLVTFIDTPGAYPGVGAESRGQSEAIATNLKVFSALKTPIISVIIGEGCSGGALGIGVCDRLLIMKYAYFSTISPEGCSTILFKSSDKAKEAAGMMGITAETLMDNKIVDRVIDEPLGGAHRNYVASSEFLKRAVLEELDCLTQVNTNKLLERRYQKIVSYGSA